MSIRRLTAVAAVLALSACGTAPAGEGRQDVVAAFYPLQFVATQVGGGHVTVSNLVRPGVEPHDLDPSASQVEALTEARLVVYLKGFQPAIDDVVSAQGTRNGLDVATVEPLRNGDPHIWLDPVRLAAIGDAVGKRLAADDRANAADYTARAADLHRRLTALDGEYRAGLAHCRGRTFVVSHAAFAYLAQRYGLEQRAIAGITPDAEPSAGKLVELADYARSHSVRVVFFERLVSDKTARTLASEVGARTDVLDPLEGLEPGSSGDYFSVMRTNLGKLRTALECA